MLGKHVNCPVCQTVVATPSADQLRQSMAKSDPPAKPSNPSTMEPKSSGTNAAADLLPPGAILPPSANVDSPEVSRNLNEAAEAASTVTPTSIEKPKESKSVRSKTSPSAGSSKSSSSKSRGKKRRKPESKPDQAEPKAKQKEKVAKSAADELLPPGAADSQPDATVKLPQQSELLPPEVVESTPTKLEQVPIPIQDEPQSKGQVSGGAISDSDAETKPAGLSLVKTNEPKNHQAGLARVRKHDSKVIRDLIVYTICVVLLAAVLIGIWLVVGGESASP